MDIEAEPGFLGADEQRVAVHDGLAKILVHISEFIIDLIVKLAARMLRVTKRCRTLQPGSL